MSAGSARQCQITHGQEDVVPGSEADVRRALRWIDPDRASILPREPHQIDVLADQSTKHLQRAVDGLVDVEHHGRDRLLAGEGEELASEVGRVFGRLADLLEILTQRRARIPIRQRQFHLAQK